MNAMKQDDPQNKKDSIMKTLAVAGFIGIVIVIAWLSIQLVHIAPGVFTSLASLAETMNQSGSSTETTTPQILLTSPETDLIDSGEAVRISWDAGNAPGSYTFSYACIDGVAVDLNDVDGIQGITCDTTYNLSTTSQLTLTIDSEKERYANVVYTIAFLGTNDTKPRAVGSSSVTVLNRDIQEDLSDSEEDSTETETDDTDAQVPTPPTTSPAPTDTDTTTAVTPETPPAPTVTQDFIYTYSAPASNPNGRTDLAIRFVDTGTIIGKTFFPGQLVQEEAGAVQFEVKNHGTKTSEPWTFSVTLPSGERYVSSAQEPLKPNERAILTVGFQTGSKAAHTFTLAVDSPTDQTRINNQTEERVVLFE